MSKSKEKNIKNIRKAIIILVIMLIILLIALIILYNNPTDKTLRYIYNTKEEGNIDIMPTNVDKLFEVYSGNVNQRSLYKAMYCFATEYVEKYYLDTKNLSNDGIEEYFDSNSKSIEKELGISDKDKFNSFCENLKNNLSGDNLNLVSYTINPNYIKRTTSSTECSIVIKYDNNSKIAFYLSIQNELNENKTPIYYEACTDEEILSYEYTNNNYVTPDAVQSPGKVIE